MGVIDLDARVKKLEQGGGAVGPEIDQLEAAVTSLENTVDGLIEDVSDKITVHEGITMNPEDLYIRAYRIGNVVYLAAIASITGGSQTQGTEYAIFDVDSTITPEKTVSAYCSGQSAAVSRVNVSSVSSTILVTAGNFARFEVFWFVAPAPSPEPTP